MRIGIEAQRIFRRKKHGMEIVALETIRQLQKSDSQNEYVIFVKDDEDTGCLHETNNFRIVKVPGFSYADWEQIALPQAAKKEKLDLLHATSNTAPLLHTAPLVLTLHDIIYLEGLKLKGSAYQNLGHIYRKVIVPRIIHQSKAIITVSAFEKDAIQAYFQLEDHQVKFIYNGKSTIFKVIEHPKLLASTAAKFNLPGAFLLCFGNTAQKKNTFRMLQAYGIYCQLTPTPLPLVLIDCSSSYLHRILTQLNNKSIAKHILCVDHVEAHELPAIYNLSTVFLYPSLRESFGLPIIEAMACGTPVITSNTSAMPEIAGDAAILVDPYNPEAIAHAIIGILQDSSLYRLLQAKGLVQSSRFTWEATAEQVLKTYQQVNDMK